MAEQSDRAAAFWTRHDLTMRALETDSLPEFEELLHHPDPRVRGACGGNPRISREQMDLLLADPRFEARAYAIAVGIRYPDADQMLRMVHDRSVNVRWNVLFRHDVPREAVEVLAQDPDADTARHAKAWLDGSVLDATPREYWDEQLARVSAAEPFGS